MADAPKRWSQQLEKGLYLRHLVHCPRNADRRTSRTCSCTSYYAILPDGRRSSPRTTFHAASRKLARAEYARLRVEARAIGEARRTGGRGVMLRSVFETYAKHMFATREWSEQTLPNRLYIWNDFIDPKLGEVPVDRVGALEILEWWAWLSEGEYTDKGEVRKYAASTRNKTRSLLRCVLEFAIDSELIADNPLLRCRLSEAKRDKTQEQKIGTVLGGIDLLSIADAADTYEYRALILLLAFAGLRKAEAAALTWQDLELDIPKPRVHVRRAARWIQPNLKRQARANAGDLKEITTRRSVPVAPILLEALRDLKTGNESPTDHVWPGTVEFIDEHGLLSRSVHPDYQLSRRAINDILTRAWEHENRRRALHATQMPPLAPITPHLCRHSCASMMLRQGYDIERVAKYLGDEPDTIRKIYAHMIEGDVLDDLAYGIDPTTSRETHPPYEAMEELELRSDA